MSHYFDTPEGPAVERSIDVRFWDTGWTFTTASGVFSYDGLDLGTGVLLRTHGPSASARRVLDLGCGWGVLAVALATAAPLAEVDAVDTNERALALTRRNADAHRVGERVRTLRPEDADDGVRYDEIWSNPPIRIGKDALHHLLLSWLPRLKPDGVARLVVGRNLGADSLQRWLIDQGWSCERTASAKGFRVFEVRPLARRNAPGTLEKPTRARRLPMGFGDDIKNKAQEVGGKIKEGVGDLTDNERLEAEGKADQLAAKGKQAVEDVKEGAAEAFNDAADAVDRKN